MTSISISITTYGPARLTAAELRAALLPRPRLAGPRPPVLGSTRSVAAANTILPTNSVDAAEGFTAYVVCAS